MVKIQANLQPLIQDLFDVVPKKFLISSSFLRLLVDMGMAEQWQRLLERIHSDRKFVVFGESRIMDSEDALIFYLNQLYMNNLQDLVGFLTNMLIAFCEDSGACIDIDAIVLDLKILGVTEESIENFRMAYPWTRDDAGEPIQVDQTDPKVKIRELEAAYKKERSISCNSNKAIESFQAWFSAALVYLSENFDDSDPDYRKIKAIEISGNGNVLSSIFDSIEPIYNILMNKVKSQEEKARVQKPPLLFISHSSGDKDFVSELVNLLESLGFDEKTLFCSTIPGYGIRLNDDIFHTLYSLFHEYNIFVLFVHSPRYYQSHVSLNEMGAAWILKSDFCSLLTKDMEFKDLDAVVKPDHIAIKVNADDAYARLNELKNILVEKFNLEPMDLTKWERKRDSFLRSVKSL